MPLSPYYLEQAIKALSKRLLDDEENLLIRREAAKSLGILHSEKAIPILCQALDCEQDVEVKKAIMDAIITIHSPMSNNKYQINNPQNVQINEQGDGHIHNYPSSQNLERASQEIQQLIQQLKRDNPQVTEKELVEEELVKKDSRIRQMLVEGGIELIKTLVPYLGVPIEMGRKWLETAKKVESE